MSLRNDATPPPSPQNSKLLIEPFKIDQLQPFPLPKSLEGLPNANFEQFINNEELIKGYIKDLETYKTHQDTIVDRLSQLQGVIKQEILDQLLTQYINQIQIIKNQLKSIHQIYQDFLNLETYQYQLLSSNFNQDYLIKNKFTKLIESNKEDSMQIIKKFGSKNTGDDSNIDEGEFNELIGKFKQSRQLYHLRKEKLNRFNEERVSGFI
ncbi:hypothetical protein DFJ63DRAFT_310488 [Scheffersomyces coipomensis]|uniref:uncharacterized protein n=1 Tax=Scheffersomyces coipomensis TaxID=1788519 RepID=UPI00315C7A44